MKAIEYARDGMFVPESLTREMIENTEIQKNQSILVLFSYEMLPILKELDYTDVTLAFDKPRTSIYNIAKYFGYKVKKLEEIENMKFDVGLGNPPFQNTHTAKRWPLWHEFVLNSIERTDKVAMITPASLIGPGRVFDAIKNNLKVLNLNVKKHFNVGSSFCYFVYDISYKGKTKILTENGNFNIDLSRSEEHTSEL